MIARIKSLRSLAKRYCDTARDINEIKSDIDSIISVISRIYWLMPNTLQRDLES